MTVTRTNRWLFYVVLLAGIASIGTHFYLSTHYYELNLGLTSGSAVCNINSTFNCDTVSASKYSTLFNIPMSVWGLSTQLVLVLFTIVYGLGLSSDDARMGRYAFYTSSVAAVTSLIMGSISLFFLKSYCLFCIFAYILSFIQFSALWKLSGSPIFIKLFGDIRTAFSQSRWVALSVLAIIPLAILFKNMFLDHFGGSLLLESVETSFLSWNENKEQNNFTLNGLIKGPENSKMVVVEFADFLCPHCKHAAPTLRVFSNTHPDVKFIFKAFPLDGSCNADSKMPKGDGTRCTLTKTVFCAEKIAQKGWYLHEKIFENQELFYKAPNTLELLEPFIKESGLDPKSLDECRNSEETHKTILDQSQEGSQAKIEGTPAIFVNGKLLSRGGMLPVLQKVYDSLN